MRNYYSKNKNNNNRDSITYQNVITIPRQNSTEVQLSDIYDNSLETGNKLRKMYENSNRRVTLFCNTPIKHTREYEIFVNPQRRIFLLSYIILCICSPLVFRYVMGTNSKAEDNELSQWGSDISATEWFILMVVFLDTLSNVLKGLPMISGQPSQLEASRKCVVDGHLVLSHCSPFVSEDDAILLRSLLGRTCTMLKTCGGRHSLQGLYIDSILNERRLKGELHRRFLWLSWMLFVTRLIRLCVKVRQREGATITAEYEIQRESTNTDITSNGTYRQSTLENKWFVKSTTQPIKVDADVSTERAVYENGLFVGRDTMVLPSGMKGRPKTTPFQKFALLAACAKEAANIDAEDDVVDSACPISAGVTYKPRVGDSFSIPAEVRQKFESSIGFLDATREDVDEEEAEDAEQALSPAHAAALTLEKKQLEYERKKREIEMELARKRSPENNATTCREEPSLSSLPNLPLKVDLSDIVSMVQFLSAWLEVIKAKEWTYNFNNTSYVLPIIAEVFIIPY
jgi:hypothetical protein